MNFKNFSDRKNKFVSRMLDRGIKQDHGVFSFTPAFIRREFAAYNHAMYESTQSKTLTALKQLYVRRVSIGTQESKALLFDALQLAYIHTAISTDGQLLDGRVFLEYVFFFLRDRKVVLQDMDDILLYSLIVTRAHMLMRDCRLIGEVDNFYPPCIRLVQQGGGYHSRTKELKCILEDEFEKALCKRTALYDKGEGDYIIKRKTFLKHYASCEKISRRYLYHDTPNVTYNEDDFLNCIEILQSGCDLKKIMPNLITRDLFHRRPHRKVSLESDVDRYNLKDFDEVLHVQPVVNPRELLDDKIWNRVGVYKFELPLKEEKYFVDELVLNCGILLDEKLLYKIMRRLDHPLPDTFKMIINESDHESTMRVINILDQLVQEKRLNDKNTIILCLNGTGGGIDATFFQVLRFQKLPCNVVVNCEMLTSASMYYLAFKTNFEFIDPHPPVLNHADKGVLLWKNFESMYRLIMRLFRNSSKAVLISKIYMMMFMEYSVKDVEHIHSDQFVIISNSQL